MLRNPRFQIVGDAGVEVLTGKALKDVNKSHDETAQVASMATFVGRSSRMVFAGRKEVRHRQGYGGTTFALRRLVEAAGVEPFMPLKTRKLWVFERLK